MRRWVTTIVIGAALLALPACGGKTDETARAAGMAPPDTLAFFTVNLSPSIEQKRNLLSVARKFPGAREEAKGEFEDARDGLLDEITEEAGLDFARDVKPWLGQELALVVLPFDRGDDPRIVVLMDTKDEAKAKATFEKARSKGKFDGQFRIVKGFVAVTDLEDEADETAVLDRIQRQAKSDDGGLAATKRFTNVIDKLHGDRLLLAWADGKALEKSFEGAGTLPGLGLIGRDTESGPIAADFHAEKSSLVIEGFAEAPKKSGGGEPNLSTSLPIDTLAALTLFNLRSPAESALKLVTGFGGDDALDDFERSSGLDIDADVLSWMEGEVALVAGEVPPGQDFPDFALVIEPSDRPKAEAGLAKIVAAIGANAVPLAQRPIAGVTAHVAPQPISAGIQPAMALFADRFVLANRPEYLEKLAKGAKPGFGDGDDYASVVGEGSSSNTAFQLVVRIDPIREAIEKSLSGSDVAGYGDDRRANVEPLDTFGMFSRQEGDVHHFAARLTFD